MYVQMQGVNLAPKVKELEKRIEMLENLEYVFEKLVSYGNSNFKRILLRQI